MITTNLFKYKFLPAKKKSGYLMIVLHGRGDSIRPFYSFDKELNIPEMNYLLLNAPRKFMDGYSWYGEPPYQRQGVLKIREKLFDLLNDLENQGWKSSNIFLFGFSQGCLISADIGMNYPKKLAGVIGISGYFHFYPRWRSNISTEARKTPWFFTHGHKDDVLPLDETKYGIRKLKESGLTVELVEMDKDHSLKDEELPVIKRWIRKCL
ncbi:MAG: alpha/beta hydrolase [Pseudobdellovibrionaceae bacterium]